MRSRALVFFLMFLAGCKAEREGATDLDQPRLYLWLPGADDHVPPSVPSPVRAHEPPSSHRLTEAVLWCGGTAFEIGGDGLAGEELSMPSGGGDEAMIDCVRSKVSFGFNASRSTRRLWRDAQQGQLIER